MGASYMDGMVPYYRAKLPAFYALEIRDWKAAAALEPQPGAPPEVSNIVSWARAVAHGRLRQPAEARADLAALDELMLRVRQGKRAYMADGTFVKIERAEMQGWIAFAAGQEAEAVKNMRAAADLQDQVGQAEVDVPAREMLGDMLMEFGNARGALAEYEIALKLSPNRLNGLYNAGRAAEKAGESSRAKGYYTALLKSTGNGAGSTRPELDAAKRFLERTSAKK
jgi:tetratricopeptide (TPR) repeat protein